VALVQGASRGIGLEFVRQLLERPGYQVIATCRQPERAEGLAGLREAHAGRLQVVPLDLLEPESIERAVDTVAASHSHLDLLINVSAVLHIPGKMVPETALSRISADAMQLSFLTNAVGPMLTCQQFMPLLAAAAAESGASDTRPAVVANMSARVGSIGDNRLGGWYSYRGSKAALNQMTKTMSLEVARRKSKVACLLLHPGTTATDLSEPFQKNVKPEMLFPVDRTVRQLLAIIDGTTMEDNGRYVAWDGQDIPW